MRTWLLGRRDPARDIAALAGVLGDFPESARAVFAAAAGRGDLSRHHWDNCPFRRAGEQVGERVGSVADAARVFGLPPGLVYRFLATWDELRGSNRYCTGVLREALRCSAEEAAGAGSLGAPAVGVIGHDDDRAVSVVEEVVAQPPHEAVDQAGVAAVADDDEVGVLRAGGLEQCLHRFVLGDDGAVRDPGLDQRAAPGLFELVVLGRRG
jgi:hypothetical protein